jgi:predicted nucleic acid-binding protein
LTTLVVDASVAIKWCVPAQTEPLVHEASELLKRHRTGEIELLVPDIFWAEVGNVLWKSIQQGKAHARDAKQGLQLLRALQLPTTAIQELLSQAMEIALRYSRSVYDSLYIALAEQAQCDLITADEKLANAVAAYLPVKWLARM